MWYYTVVQNASRYGKLAELAYTRGAPGSAACGGAITAVRLEARRVVARPAEERSFHVFYQLCAGAGRAEVAPGESVIK
jgi:myosin-5